MTLSVHVVRSARRRRTAGARLVGDRLEIRLPAGLEPAEEQRLVQNLRRRFERRAIRARLAGSESALLERALELSRRYFQGRLSPAAVEYAPDQDRRFGSCSVRSRRLRLSHRLAAFPEWVRDYVLVHELAHLQEPNHSPAFWGLVNRYPLAERARGYLMASGLEPPAGLDPAPGAGEGKGVEDVEDVEDLP
jgi:Protein of unknown function DUF45